MGMSVNLEQVHAISRLVALEHGRGLAVDGVTFSDGGTDRVEILVSISGCHTGPCRFSLNVSRADGVDFEREFRAKLITALQKHAAD